MGFDIFLNFGYRMVSIRIILDKTPYNIQMLFKIFSYFQMVTRTKKIFVGGLSAPSTLDDVKAYFEQFGRVSNLNLYMNKYFISQTFRALYSIYFINYYSYICLILWWWIKLIIFICQMLCCKLTKTLS